MILIPRLPVEVLATWLIENDDQPLWELNAAIDMMGYSRESRQAALVIYADRMTPLKDVDLCGK